MDMMEERKGGRGHLNEDIMGPDIVAHYFKQMTHEIESELELPCFG